MMALEDRPIEMVATFNEWLAKKKTELGLEFNYELATALGIRPDQLSKIMLNRASPSALHLNAIFEHLKISPDSKEGSNLLKLYWQTKYQAEINLSARGKYKRNKS